MKRIFYLGPLYPEEKEQTALNIAKGTLNAAPNNFQLSLLKGFRENGIESLKIINVLPVGIWPSRCRSLVLRNEQWKFEKYECSEIGSLNLPLVKQWQRERRVRRTLRREVRAGDIILIYSAYLPFLRAVRRFPESVHICVIITDLPEFYDVGKTSFFRKKLRQMNSRLCYNALQRADSFVLLTEAMKEPLHVGNRPYVVVEGIAPAKTNTDVPYEAKHTNAKVIFYSGTLCYQYGIRTLLDAFSMIADPDTELWICGSGEAENEIYERSKRDQRIRFFGFCSKNEVEQLRSQASLLINPRTAEGEYTKFSFPSKTMEYLASGIPVVMYKLPGIPDEYDPFLIYIRWNTAEDMKKVLADTLALPDSDRKEIGCKAREFVNTNKTPACQSQKIYQFLCNLM